MSSLSRTQCVCLSNPLNYYLSKLLKFQFDVPLKVETPQTQANKQQDLLYHHLRAPGLFYLVRTNADNVPIMYLASPS